MKNAFVIILITLLFGLVGYTMMSDPIPVLTYDRAQQHDGKLQIKGTPVKTEFSYDDDSQEFSFFLIDDNGQKFNVRYNGVKPGNYDQANEVIVIGRYDEAGYIRADRLLVKCPSKYEGTEQIMQEQVIEY